MKTRKLASVRGQMHKARAAKNRAAAREDSLRVELHDAQERISELERELETCRSDLEAATEACEELDGDLRAANQEWQPIETAPKDRRILGELIKALDSARKDMIRLSFECDTGYEPSQRMIDEIISKSESESPVGKITAAMVAAQKQEGSEND